MRPLFYVFIKKCSLTARPGTEIQYMACFPPNMPVLGLDQLWIKI